MWKKPELPEYRHYTPSSAQSHASEALAVSVETLRTIVEVDRVIFAIVPLAGITLLSIFLPTCYGFRNIAGHGVECQAVAAKY